MAGTARYRRAARQRPPTPGRCLMTFYVWGADLRSLVVFLLEGDAAHSRVWLAAAEHIPNRGLMPSAWDRNECLMALFREMRKHRLHGREA